MLGQLIGPHAEENPAAVGRPLDLAAEHAVTTHAHVPARQVRFDNDEIILAVLAATASAEAFAIRCPSYAVVEAQAREGGDFSHLLRRGVIDTYCFALARLYLDNC